MPDEFSVKLCNLVQMHPELYDIYNESFRDEEAKKNAWQEIARDLGVAQSKCVIKWKSLKHQYVKAKKEENTAWDLWPYLQFLDETAAAKSGPKKRKRESTATPMRMETPVLTDVDMPSADSTGMENVEIKAATRNTRSARISSIHKETVVMPMKSTFASTETGTPLQPVATASRANPEKKETKRGTTRTAHAKRSDVTVTKVSEQSFLSQIPFLYWRASSVNDTAGEMDFSETGTPLQDTAPAPVMPEPSNKLSEPVQPTPTRGSTRRQSARVYLVPIDADVASTTRQANGTSSGTPLKTAAVVTHDEKPAVEPTANAQEAAVSEAASRKGSPRKAAAASPAPSKARVSSTPRGRRSARPAPAETIPEEQEDNVQVEPPQPKRQRMEGNGIAASEQPDALADVKFENTLDQKFFKQLKEKFDKLRPEVASTIKASIFRMLDEAADN
ncbi:uncharacterized protein LOC119396221 isoform X4 [Rhipicephalus sanguineus]|uniref:uncharacterized protein LOC119396221 isoform X4 n=1 Tax=Rhipicephalus sanguineus TaxID=34632 RepID=UPI00189312B4|nr:uncharacterized protein LOC119396221 isoform X4 [Rhipicephalus sanguineus]